MTERRISRETPEKPEVGVAVYGVGSIGRSIARLLLKKQGIKIVGAIDSAPGKVGKDLAGLIGAEGPLGVTVSSSPADLFSRVKADIVLHATSSFLRDVYPQLVEMIRHGVSVISTCEELSYPYISDEKLAAELDELARKHCVTVLGTGINPGFLMDTLVITLTGVCQDIKHINVERVIDAAKRRVPFQKKIGAGLTPEEFKEKLESKVISGHVGLEESVAMIADALLWHLQEIEMGEVEPIISEEHVKGKTVELEAGQVAGLKQTAEGIVNGKRAIALTFKAYVGAEEECDSIVVEGTPSIHEKITPCIHGDLGTAAIIVNSIPKVINAAPGLKTMKDLPVPSAVLGDIRGCLTVKG